MAGAGAGAATALGAAKPETATGAAPEAAALLAAICDFCALSVGYMPSAASSLLPLPALVLRLLLVFVFVVEAALTVEELPPLLEVAP